MEMSSNLDFWFTCFKKLFVEESNSIMGAEYIYKIKPNELSDFLHKLDGLENFRWLEANEASTN